MRFAGKVALVTGAASGVGEATAHRLASEGAVVVLNDIDASGLDGTADELDGVGHSSVRADISDSGSVDNLFEVIRERHGGLDILVSNAAVSRTTGDGRAEAERARSQPRKPGELPYLGQVPFLGDEGWQRMLEINLSATFYCARAALPLLLGRDGASIIAVSSVGVRIGVGPPHYIAAKAGLLGLVRSLAINFAPAGIRVNAVCPGAVDTPMNRAAPQPPGGIESIVPLGRAARPEELAAVICFLASADSSYVTGHTLDVNGGLYLN